MDQFNKLCWFVVTLGVVLLVVFSILTPPASQPYTVHVIDGCEYVITTGTGGGITHKANCSNPLHEKENPDE